MEPSDFCRHWVKSPKYNEWGYRQACIKLLAEATGLAENTINTWGKDFQSRPSYILNILKKDHIIRLIQEKTPSATDPTLTDIEPWEYCVYWINDKSPDERGFRTECVKKLIKATFGRYKYKTINEQWGSKFEKCPKTGHTLITFNHYLRLMQQKLYAMAIPYTEEDRILYEEILNYVNFLLWKEKIND